MLGRKVTGRAEEGGDTVREQWGEAKASFQIPRPLKKHTACSDCKYRVGPGAAVE